MSRADTVAGQYGHEKKFLAILVAAEFNARTEWEIEFTGQLRDRYEKHGKRTLLSDLQRQQLDRISGEF